MPFRLAWHLVTSAKTCNARSENGLLLGPAGGVPDHETVIELTYRVDLHKGALFVQPDFQFITRPGGVSHFKNAPVLGAQFGINF
jgi:carbohydrate-selective porin OprB